MENCKRRGEMSQFHTAQRACVILSEPASQTLLVESIGCKLLLNDIMRNHNLRMLAQGKQPGYLLFSELR